MKNRTDLTQGSILKTLYKLALPITAGMLLQTLFNIVDTIFVSRIGETALAAVSLHLPIFFLILALGNCVAIGTSSLIARSLGAKDQETANLTANQSIVLSVLIAIVSTVVGIAASPFIFRATGAQGTLLSYAIGYNTIIFIGNIFFFTYSAFDGILRGEGDMRTSMVNLMIATVCNIILDPILIFGFGPIPAFGVQGAAMATVISRAIGLFFVVRHFGKNKSSITMVFNTWMWDMGIIRKILAVGIPASVAQGMLSISLFVYNSIAMRFSESAVAALGLGFRVDSLAFLPGLGISVATVTMIGQNYGAGRLDRVHKTYFAAMGNAFLLMASIGIVFYSFPDTVMRVFGADPSVAVYGIQYLRTIPMFYGFLGIGFISSSAFQGIGEGYPSLIVNFVRLGVVGVPMAYILTSYTDLGARGLWWAIALSDITFATVGFIWFTLKVKHLKKERGTLWQKE
ncbi:MATE family efflux transporter [Alkalicella caledoniensis]|uniref:Probable multidrug resistance protein NorM n=1 Tax=Alkalicella caledoniensis TaxID=2731377 RepID=A0A7G9W520_ALKCA|nr:MATE family efflux transporter [Alkalicella caledoniensis]QNO13782.1 MATE family efflux transporter [Alkalicella caledoniensis]